MHGEYRARYRSDGDIVNLRCLGGVHRARLRAQRSRSEAEMPRYVTVGCAQLGPIARNESRPQVVRRLIELMRQAHGTGCDMIVYPELALTTFFPRWVLTEQAEIDCDLDFGYRGAKPPPK
jgi:hypothetical protein